MYCKYHKEKVTNSLLKIDLVYFSCMCVCVYIYERVTPFILKMSWFEGRCIIVTVINVETSFY